MTSVAIFEKYRAKSNRYLKIGYGHKDGNFDIPIYASSSGRHDVGQGNVNICST